MSRPHFTLPQARRIALAAQGFSTARSANPARRHVASLLDRLHLLQIDSVNVLARAHYMPLFSRLGVYDPQLLDEAAHGSPERRQVFEYWGHEASFVRLDLHPLLRWRMARAAENCGIYGGLADFARENRVLIAGVKREVAARGRISAGDLERALAAGTGTRKGGWWGWSDVKRALEWLFWAGEIAIAERRNFERIYDLTERVIPAKVLNLPTPLEHDAQRQLIRLAVKAHGIATERCLRDYFRLPANDAKARIAELAEAGELLPINIEGWSTTAWLDPDAAVPPRPLRCRALLSPFDPLVWERTRTERLHNFRYRIEIYTPAHKREFGYYTLPFLLNERIVARLDLKADRVGAKLIASSIHAEPGTERIEIGKGLAEELVLLAQWLRLEDIAVPQEWRTAIPF